jgi:hypothetical protein
MAGETLSHEMLVAISQILEPQRAVQVHFSTRCQLPSFDAIGELSVHNWGFIGSGRIHAESTPVFVESAPNWRTQAARKCVD